jgi:hypothetical protein
MRKKLRGKLTTTRGLVVVVGLIVALAWAMPAMGASPLKLAKKALTKATTALNAANKAQSTANTANGTAGQALTKANGIVPGARAFARMDNPCATSSNCAIDHARGISGIRQTATGGLYCVTAPGLSPSTDAWFASTDDGDTGGGGFNAASMPNSNGAGCNSGEFEVRTVAISTGTPRTDVAFFVTIP